MIIKRNSLILNLHVIKQKKGLKWTNMMNLA